MSIEMNVFCLWNVTEKGDPTFMLPLAIIISALIFHLSAVNSQ